MAQYRSFPSYQNILKHNKLLKSRIDMLTMYKF